MILESTQLLFSAWHLTAKKDWQSKFPPNTKIYRLTHKKHPMSIWVRKSIHNYRWLVELAYELCLEYSRRYQCVCSNYQYNCNKCNFKRHACYNAIVWMRNNIRKEEPKCNNTDKYSENCYLATKNYPKGCTPVPECMPKEYHQPDLIEAYHDYYKADKRYFAKWKGINSPKWF